MTTKEVKQEITSVLFNRLKDKTEFPSVDLMRQEVRRLFVLKQDWDKWYGCRLEETDDGRYFIVHIVNSESEGIVWQTK